MNETLHDKGALERFARAELEAGERQRVLDHVEECDDCRSWLETYDVLAACFGDDGQPGRHPSSEQIARYAVDPDLLAAQERERIDAHVSSCLPCRKEIRLTTRALEDARTSSSAASPRVRAAGPLRLAAAASILLLLGLAWGLRDAPNAPEAAAQQAEAAVDGDGTLTGGSLSGTRVIETEGDLIAGSVTVESGGDITLRAGGVVVLSDGFEIGNGATLRVEISPPTDELDSDTT